MPDDQPPPKNGEAPATTGACPAEEKPTEHINILKKYVSSAFKTPEEQEAARAEKARKVQEAEARGEKNVDPFRKWFHDNVCQSIRLEPTVHNPSIGDRSGGNWNSIERRVLQGSWEHPAIYIGNRRFFQNKTMYLGSASMAKIFCPIAEGAL